MKADTYKGTLPTFQNTGGRQSLYKLSKRKVSCKSSKMRMALVSAGVTISTLNNTLTPRKTRNRAGNKK